MAPIGQGHPLGVQPARASVASGGRHPNAAFGLHKSFPELMQGLALLLVAAKLLWERLLGKRGVTA